MRRIFITLSTLSTMLLLVAFWLGFQIEPSHRNVDAHMWAAIGGLLFALLVHAIVLTYFMGTGRWMEETGQAYRLDPRWRAENQSLKYRMIPAMIGCVVLLIVAAAFGAAADRASPVEFRGWAGLSADEVHFFLATLALCINALVHVWQFVLIDRNGELVEEIVREVRRIRQERGLTV